MKGDPSGPGVAPAKKAKKAADSEALTQLALELLAVAVFTLIAGASDEMGTLVVIFMVGMWLIYLIENSKTIAALEKAMEAA